MTQPLASDFPIDPTTTSGTALADILNRFSDSVNTSNSGASPPPDTTPGMLWLDTSVTPPIMRIRNAANTGWNSIPVSGGATGSPFLLPDGTVSAPGLSWASEPGLGLFRAGASAIQMAAVGQITHVFYASVPGTSSIGINPRAAGNTYLAMTNQPNGSANYNNLVIQQTAAGGASIATGATGTATRGNLTLDAPAVVATGSLTGAGSVQVRSGAAGKLSFATTDGVQHAEINGDPSGSVHINANGQIWLYQNDGVFAVPTANAYKPGGGAWLDSNSDVRAKEDVKPYTRGLEDILAYELFSYRYAPEMNLGERTYIGRMADRVKVIDPSMVVLSPFQGMGYDDLETIDSTPDMYKLMNAVKTLHERISALENAA